jgi:membrane protein DedA with SNARE-associated domain
MLVPVPTQLGYPVLALVIFGESAGLPLPGETALLTAGGLAAAGHLALPAVIAVAAGAAILGDTLGYWLGRRGGRALLTRDGLGAAHRRHALARADRFFARYGAVTVFLGRWIPGVRVVAAVTAGAARMPWPRFALANALGALAWAASVSSLAAAAGPTGALALALGGLGLGAVTLTASWLRQRRRAPQPQPLADQTHDTDQSPRRARHRQFIHAAHRLWGLPSTHHRKENPMVKHLKKIAAGLAALTALALGGSALAQAGGTTAKPTPQSAATSTASETPGTQQSDAADRDNVQSGDQSAPETPDAEKGESAQEPPESANETEGSEVPGDDGPGGHADEPANPNADHQHEGTE